MPSPTDISGLAFWVKADSIVSGDGGAIATWEDSSGNGRQASQGTAGNRPTYETGELNGLPVVRFTATDCMDVASFTHPSEWTVLAVARTSTAVSSGRRILDADAGGGSRHAQYLS